MKVLVTGCNGYIGSHVCEVLKEHNHHVTGWDIDIHGEANDVSAYLDHFDRIDVNSTAVVGTEFDAVVHLAGLAAVETSTRQPWEFYYTNIFGTKNVVDNVKTDHILFASTSSAWEMASPYARSKVAAEDVIRQKTNNYTIFRFFNVSGTNGRFKQLGVATHLIRIAAEVAAGKREAITVFGTDYDTRDGTCIRDYVHVCDLARAIVEAVERGPARTPYECLGSNHGYSVLDVLATMRQVTGHSVPAVMGDRRPGDAVASVVDDLSDLIQLNHTIEDMCLSQYKLEIDRS
jgi:UDP-glucose 4-epimerase